MSEAINPRVDIAFKKIFGVEENKDLTKRKNIQRDWDEYRFGNYFIKRY